MLAEFRKLLDNFRKMEKYKGIKLSTEDDVKKIPLISRGELSKFKIEDCPEKPAVVVCTSGSTGRNLFLYYSKEAQEKVLDRVVEMFRIVGVNESDTVLNILCYGVSNSGRCLDHSIFRNQSTLVPIGNLDDPQRISITTDIMKRVKPTAIVSTPNQLHEIFDRVDNTSVKKCILTGEMLLPSFRKRLESMGMEVYNMYGCDEAGIMAVQEKPNQDSMLILDDGLYIEVLKENNETDVVGEGELVVTSLHNFSMPVIRYKVGDKVEISEKDGRRYMKPLGRKDDYTKIQGEVKPKKLMVKLIYDALQHPNFFVVIDKNYDTYEDEVIVNVPAGEKQEKKEAIKSALNEIAIYPKVVEIGMKVPKTATGKFIHIIDKRKLKLDEKKLNW